MTDGFYINDSKVKIDTTNYSITCAVCQIEMDPMAKDIFQCPKCKTEVRVERDETSTRFVLNPKMEPLHIDCVEVK